MNSYRLYPILAFGATAAIIGYALLSRKNKKTAEDLERERRADLARAQVQAVAGALTATPLSARSCCSSPA